MSEVYIKIIWQLWAVEMQEDKWKKCVHGLDKWSCVTGIRGFVKLFNFHTFEISINFLNKEKVEH
jgi:pterin-4a-carbinolamine dehydratase